jgi:hypothetical protein
VFLLSREVTIVGARFEGSSLRTMKELWCYLGYD